MDNEPVTHPIDTSEADRMVQMIQDARDLIGVERITTREQVDHAIRLLKGRERPREDWVPAQIAAEAKRQRRAQQRARHNARGRN